MFETKSLTVAVADRLAKTGEKVMEAIANDRYEKEFKRRVEATAKVVENLFAIEGNLKKLDREDNVSYVVIDGKPVEQKSMSKTRFEEVKKLKEQATKLEKVLTEALEQDKWDNLFNAANGKPVAETKEEDQQ